MELCAHAAGAVIFEDAIHAIETAKKERLYRHGGLPTRAKKRQDEVRALADCYITSFEHLEQFWAMTAAD